MSVWWDAIAKVIRLEAVPALNGLERVKTWGMQVQLIASAWKRRRWSIITAYRLRSAPAADLLLHATATRPKERS